MLGHLLALLACLQSPDKVILATPELNESSGVCVSQTGEIWSHNDSGDKPRLFAFRTDGTLIAECLLQGAKAIDWEDICAFTWKGRDYFAVGDVGDNQARRTSIQIYIFQQPDLSKVKNGKVTVRVECCLNVTYPKRPVNCEGLAFDPVTKNLVLVSKETLFCQLFQVPLGELEVDQDITAKAGPKLFVPLVTGADIATDGKHLVLATYGPGVLLSRKQDATKSWNTDRPHTFQLPQRKQGESICFTDDNHRLLLTSEFVPTPLFTVACPTP